MRKTFIILLFFSLTGVVHAEYILPYPSSMPGSKLYTISRIVDRLQQYWYWGNIAKTRYYMDLSDKYLVEAKTLMEYKQYLLGVDALNRSNGAFVRIHGYIDAAKKEGKDVSYLETAYKEEADVHIGVLEKLKSEIPSDFTWTPEKSDSTELNLHRLLEEARFLRCGS